MEGRRAVRLGLVVVIATVGCEGAAPPEPAGVTEVEESTLRGVKVGPGHGFVPCAPPTAFPQGGLYVNGPMVRVRAVGGARVFATTDGTDPTSSESRVEVTAPIPLQRSTILAMVAQRGDGAYSSVETEIYVVTTPPPVDVLAPGERVQAELAPLGRQRVPMPNGLGFFVKDRRAAIALGKALFWDQQVGSDGAQACASCHFSAGADSRSKNQINPGTLALLENGQPDPAGTVFTVGGGGPNLQLSPADYPFHRLADINDRHSMVLFDSMNVTSSQGVVNSLFGSILPLLGLLGSDTRSFVADPVFNVGGRDTRRVEPRNTPTMINAVFNFRNFWDGRAQFEFNGMNPFGARDPALRDPDMRSGFLVRTAPGGGGLFKTHVLIDNSSLASQAVGPVLSAFEMSAAARTFPDVGAKMTAADRVPLAGQDVAFNDSVLGRLASPSGQGLTVGYADLIRRAFRSEWWDGAGQVVQVNADGSADLIPAPTGELAHGEFTAMQWNFSLFFGLAVQLYEATLVADDTPFDRFLSGWSRAISEQAKRGLVLFQTKAKCIACHSGPELTHASVARVLDQKIERMIMGNEKEAVYDNGFYNIGVRPTLNDIGIGGNDPFGNPLALARLAVQERFEDPHQKVVPGERVAVDGAFKTPGLRNVALTAPYFHNGGQLTLRQVVDFYNRGGDFHNENEDNLDPNIENLHLTDSEKAALVAFLESLTDERVRFQRAPFDHPGLALPNGHPGDQNAVEPDPNFPLNARELDPAQRLIVPAVGAGGAAPVLRFLQGVH